MITGNFNDAPGVVVTNYTVGNYTNFVIPGEWVDHKMGFRFDVTTSYRNYTEITIYDNKTY